MMLTPDDALIQRIATRDRAAFAALYQRHAGRLFGLMVKILGPGAEAEDALQEVFLQIWNQAGRFEPERSSVATWLTLLARSRSIDLLRRRAKRPTVQDFAEPAFVTNPAATLESDERRCRIEQALSCLPTEQRQAIVAAYFGGLTYEEVARQQTLPLGTVKTRIRQGMQRLRTLLADPAEVSA